MTGGRQPRCGRSPLQGKQGGHGPPRFCIYEPPPPFIGTWEQMHGGEKKNKQLEGSTVCHYVKIHHSKTYLC